MPQFGASLADDSRVVIYDRNMCIVQATDYCDDDDAAETTFYPKKSVGGWACTIKLFTMVSILHYCMQVHLSMQTTSILV